MDLFEIVGRFAIKDADKTKEDIDGVTEKAKKSSGIFGTVGGKIAGAIGAAFATHKIIGFGKDVIATTQTFSDSMLKVQSLSGASGDELQKLNDTALQYGSTTAWTASQVADGMGYMALAGFNTNEIMAAIPGTLGLASASGTDLARASDILTDAITAFGYEAKDATKFADVLATTQAKSNTTVDALGEAFKYAGTVAGTYKYSVEDVSTALGLMANAGVKGSMAGTAFSSIVSRLGTNTKGARSAIEELGVEFFNADGTARDLSLVLTELADATAGMTVEEKAHIAKVVAGQEAQKGLLAILNQGSDAYKDLNEQLKACDGSASNMSGTMESGIGGAIRTMESALEGFKIKLGQKFEPYIATALQKVAGFVTNTVVPAMDGLFTKLDETKAYLSENKDAIDNVISAVEILVGAWAGFKIGSELQKGVNYIYQAATAIDTFMFSTEGATIAQGILQGQLSVGQAIVGLFTGQVTLADLATGLWAKTQAVLNAVMSANPIALVVMAIAAVIAIIVVLYNKCEWFRDFINKLGGYIKTGLSVAFEFIKSLPEKIHNAFNAVVDFFKNNWQALAIMVVNPFVGGFKLLYDNCEGFRNFINKLLDGVKNAFNAVVDWFKNVGEGIKNGFNAVVDWFKSVPEKIQNAFSAVLNWLAELPNKIAYFLGYAIGSVVNFAIEFGAKAKEAGTNFVNNLVNNVKELPAKFKYSLTITYERLVEFGTNAINKAKEVGSNFVNNLINFVKTLPSKIATWFTNTMTKVSDFAKNIANKAREAGSNFVNNLINFIRTLPSKIANFFTTVISAISNFAVNMKNKASEAGRGFVTNIMNALRALPGQVVSIGKNVVTGIWNGITGSYAWIRGKITEWCGSFVQGFKNALGIHSPSRVTRDGVGKPLVEGIAVGIAENKEEVSKEFQKMLDDLQLQRDLDVISDEDYYSQLEFLRNKYLKKGTSDWWEYTKEIIDHENQMTDDLKKSFEDLNTEYEDHLKEREDLTSNFYKKVSGRSLYDEAKLTDKNGTVSFYSLKDWTEDIEFLDNFESKILSVQDRLKKVFADDAESLQTMLDTIRSDPFGEGDNVLQALSIANDKELEKWADGYKQYIEKSKNITSKVYEDDLKAFDTDFLSRIAEKFKGSPVLEELKSLGANMTESLMNGINEKADWLKEQITKFCNSVSQMFGDGFSVGALGDVQLAGTAGINSVRNYQTDYTPYLNNINDSIDRFISLVGQYLPEISQKIDRPIMIDGNSLAVGMAKSMDSQLGKISVSKGRGNV